MTVRLILAAGALLASTSAWAQAPGAEQTTEDIICQLSERCVEEEASPAEEATQAQAAPSGARVSATRGFAIARKSSAPAASNNAAAKPAARASGGGQSARVATERAKKPVAGSPGRAKGSSYVEAATRPLPLGRADLRVSFVSGSAELTEAGQREAQKFAAALSSPLLQGLRFTIEGHTDAAGGREYNLDLSRRRAQAVVDYLVGKGADRARFDIVGHGFDRPIEGTSAANPANRRVEVVKIR